VGLSQKDQYIHHLSSKLQKLEFNSKETIVLLSDLTDNKNVQDEVQSVLSLCLNYLRKAQQTETPAVPAPLFHDVEEDLEEGELERRQAAMTEWRKKDVVPDRSSATDPACWTIPDPEEPLNLMDGLDSASSSHVSDRTDLDSVRQEDGHPRFSTSTSISSSLHHTPTPTANPLFFSSASAMMDDSHFCTNCKQLLAQLDQQIEQKAYLKRDLSSLASALSEEESLRATVEQDKEALEEDVEDITSSLFTTLNQILMDEVTDRDGLVKLSREQNGKLEFVLDAWDLRDSRLRQVKDLLVQLDSAVHQSTNTSATISRRYSQYPDQRQSFDGDEDEPLSPTVTRFSSTRASHPLRFSVNMDDSIVHGHRRSKGNAQNRTIRIDGFVFSDFQQHVKALGSSTAAAIPATAFFKRVMTEDVEPCLFFQSQVGWWKSPWFKRKLLDAISKNKCEIQSWNGHPAFSSSVFSTTTNSSSTTSITTSPSTSHISTSSNNNHVQNQQQQPQPMPPKTKCTCCNLLRVCEFRMRLPTPSSSGKNRQQPAPAQPWLPIDRFCRDKLVAVCDYYSFMSHLKLLVNSSSVLNLFKQVMLYRRKMTLAKVGSVALFEEEDEERPSSPYRRQSSSRRHRQKRESIVLDHSGSGSDTASVVSVSEIQGLEGTAGQIIIVH
jgi:hypothetical protein